MTRLEFKLSFDFIAYFETAVLHHETECDMNGSELIYKQTFTDVTLVVHLFPGVFKLLVLKPRLDQDHILGATLSKHLTLSR